MKSREVEVGTLVLYNPHNNEVCTNNLSNKPRHMKPLLTTGLEGRGRVTAAAPQGRKDEGEIQQQDQVTWISSIPGKGSQRPPLALTSALSLERHSPSATAADAVTVTTTNLTAEVMIGLTPCSCCLLTLLLLYSR